MLKEKNLEKDIFFLDTHILGCMEEQKFYFSKYNLKNEFERVLYEKYNQRPIRVVVLKKLEIFIILDIMYDRATYKCRLQKRNLQIDKVYQINSNPNCLLLEILYFKKIKIKVKYYNILFYSNNKLVRKTRREDYQKYFGINLLKVLQHQSLHIKELYYDTRKRFRDILISTNNALIQINEIRLYQDVIVFITLGPFYSIYVTDKRCLNTPKGYYCKLESDKTIYKFQDFCRYQEKYFVLISIRNESVRLHLMDDGIISKNNLICMIYNTNQCRFFDGYIYYFEFNKGIKRMEIPFQ